MRPTTNPRKFERVINRSWCFMHGAWEAVYENNYRVCFECGHSLFTERALVYLENERRKGLCEQFGTSYEQAVDASTISACPLCGMEWGSGA